MSTILRQHWLTSFITASSPTPTPQCPTIGLEQALCSDRIQNPSEINNCVKNHRHLPCPPHPHVFWDPLSWVLISGKRAKAARGRGTHQRGHLKLCLSLYIHYKRWTSAQPDFGESNPCRRREHWHPLGDFSLFSCHVPSPCGPLSKEKCSDSPPRVSELW